MPSRFLVLWVEHSTGWGSRIRTYEYQSQSLAPYRLAIPQYVIWCPIPAGPCLTPNTNAYISYFQHSTINDTESYFGNGLSSLIYSNVIRTTDMGLVQVTGLEPVRYCYRGIFLLLYVAIATFYCVVVWNTSLPYYISIT